MSKIDDLKTKLTKMEADAHLDTLLPKDAGWLSRKLIVLLILIGLLAFVLRDTLPLLVQATVALGMTWMIVQGVLDACKSRDDRKVRIALIYSMGASNEIQIVTVSDKNPADPADSVASTAAAPAP